MKTYLFSGAFPWVRQLSAGLDLALPNGSFTGTNLSPMRETTISVLQKRFGEILRGLFLVLSVAALATSVVWKFAPQAIECVDRAVVLRHLDRFEKRLLAARQLVESDEKAAAAAYEAILLDLKEIKKGDRLGRKKREALNELSLVLSTAGKTDRALSVCEEWVEFDDRDLIPKIHKADLLLRGQNTRVEGEEYLMSLARTFPGSQAITRLAAQYLFDQGRANEADALIEAGTKVFEKQIAGSEWTIWWDAGKGFTSSSSRMCPPDHSPPNHLRLDVSLPAGAYSAFRFKSPDWLGLRLSDIRLTLDDRTEEIKPADLDLIGFTLLDNSIGTDGDNSHFAVQLGQRVTTSGPLHLTLEARADPPLPALTAKGEDRL
ncbi:MAG: hypothetical protein KJ626_15895 [Verrucomicrobia bacterium]|nr:hypothetical protein [Verrucomicrobiota bacterium]